jgi:hypothetical protein
LNPERGIRLPARPPPDLENRRRRSALPLHGENLRGARTVDEAFFEEQSGEPAQAQKVVAVVERVRHGGRIRRFLPLYLMQVKRVFLG